jgi:predicted Zn-dependent protease
MQSPWYAAHFGGGQVDITSGKFVFSASEAYWVENGKILYPVKGATLIGNGPEAMNRISMIGNDLKLDSGVGTCGKDGQSMPVGVGAADAAALIASQLDERPESQKRSAASIHGYFWLFQRFSLFLVFS